MSLVMKIVGTEEVPEGTCGFSEYQGGPLCGQPITMHGLIKTTWEGDSKVGSCADHADALEYVADEVWPA